MKNLFLLFAFALLYFQAYGQGSGYALNFDGTNDYVRADGVSNLVASGNLTVTCWFRSNSTTFGAIFAFNVNSSSGSNNRILFYNSAVYDTSVGSNIPFATSITDGKWHHVAYVLDIGTNTSKIYIDGIEDLSLSTSISVGSTDRFSIGQEWDSNTPSAFLDGSVDELSVWNKALTQTEIRTNMCKKLTGSEAGLVAYYRMDEGADNTCSGGEDICDLTGNNNHGVKF